MHPEWWVWGMDEVTARMNGMGPGMMHGRAGLGLAHPAQLETLKTELGITPAQEQAWSKYAKAVQDAAVTMKTTGESVDPDAVSKMSPADRYAFVSKMREQGQRGSAPSRRQPTSCCATLDATQKAKASDILPGIAFGPARCAGRLRANQEHKHRRYRRNPLGAAASRGSSSDTLLARIFPCRPRRRLLGARRFCCPARRRPVGRRRTAAMGASCTVGRTSPADPTIDRGTQRRAGEACVAEHAASIWLRTGSAVTGHIRELPGPVVRVRNGDTIPFRVDNRLDEETTLHWHGMLVPSHVDGGPHNTIKPGAVWSPEITIKQPASTNWFHPHPHGNTAPQVYSGLAGMMIVTDGGDRDRGLPETYGVDDLPIVLQDKRFNRDGDIVYQPDMMDMMHGFQGDTLVVNGAIASHGERACGHGAPSAAECGERPHLRSALF